MADLKPIEDITKSAGNSELVQLIRDLNALETKAAQWAVVHVGEDLAKYKKSVQTTANRLNLSVRFGDDTPADGGGTVVQGKVVPKAAVTAPPAEPVEPAATPAKK